MNRQWFIVSVESNEHIDPNRLHNAVEHIGVHTEVVEMPEADNGHFDALKELQAAHKRYDQARELLELLDCLIAIFAKQEIVLRYPEVRR